MTSNHSQRARVNDNGNPIIPADVARQYGIQPGGELFLDEKDDGIFLRRADFAFGKSLHRANQ